MAEMRITLKTLTPLWTGGVDGTCDRLHETGLIGSLRWWYEAIVRGLGGYVSDPTAEDPQARSEFDTQAYEKARRAGKSGEEALREGLKTVCPVSYLFGATGWARLFQLQVIDAPTTPLHFRTTLSMNRGWLTRIFGGKSRNINNLRVPYGELRCRVVLRGHDPEFAKDQVALALRFAAEYGGLGARLQHGFGQVELTLPPAMQHVTVASGLAELANRLRSGGWRTDGPTVETPFNLRNFVSLTYDIPAHSLAAFTGDQAHFGSPLKRDEICYLPCAFDLRYKGADEWGMRRWLKEQKGWRESDDPKRLGPLDELLGPRSQWGPKDRERLIEDDLRTASRVFFSMPYLIDSNTYRLRVFGFAPPHLLAPEDLEALCNEYIQSVFNVPPVKSMLGKTLLAEAEGGR